MIPKQQSRIPKTRVTTTINSELWRLAAGNEWAWNDLLEFAIRFKIADINGFDYPTSNLSEKVEKLIEKLSVGVKDGN